MRNRNIGRAVMAVVLSVTMIGTGCSTTWIEEAEQIVEALIPASTHLVTLVAALQGKTVSAVDLATIQNGGTQAAADLQLVRSLIAAYESADETGKAGILAEIQTALTGVQSNLQGLLAGLHIKDAATQGKVTAVVALLLSEVQSLQLIVPVMQGQVSGHRVQAAVLSRSARRNAPLSANAFVKSYNASLTAKTGNAELDRVTEALQIHLHSSMERWGSAGVLK
jgi:hypothetical protein